MKNHEGAEEHDAAFGRSQKAFFTLGGLPAGLYANPLATRLF